MATLNNTKGEIKMNAKIEGSKVIKKVAECASMVKTKEGRAALMAKTKSVAAVAKDKTVALWKSGPQGKAILCAIAFLALWLVIPSCRDESGERVAQDPSATKGAGDFHKLRDSDELWFEGTLPEGLNWQTDHLGLKWLSEGDDEYETFESISPNLIVLPRNLSLISLLSNFNPDIKMPGYRQKGVSYLLNGSIVESVISHVGDGYVIARPSGYFCSVYGNHSGYIATGDEYVEGDALKTGFYTYTGTKTVPLANGSSLTMHAFAKLDERLNRKALEVVEYNQKAVEAAKNEMERRIRRERKEFERDPAAQTDKMLSNALAHYDYDREYATLMTKVHVSGALKGRLQITDATTWPWYSEEGQKGLPFHEFKQKFEKCSKLKYVEKWYGGTCNASIDNVQSCTRFLFARDEHTLFLKKSDAACTYRCYIIMDKLSRYDGENPTSIVVYNQSKRPVYIIDVAEDDDIVEVAELSKDWDNGAAAFVAAFEKKYGKK